MCSTFKYRWCMGRNYDYEQSFNEMIALIPKAESVCCNEYDVIGVCSGLFKEYPMLYDGMNENGLCMSGLAFSGNATYLNYNTVKCNVAPYELIPFVLGNFESVNHFIEEVVDGKGLNIIDKQFNDRTPNSDLHWFLCDKDKSIVIESTDGRVSVNENPYNVLTNNPPFWMMEDEIDDLLWKIGISTDYDEDEWTSRGTETLGLMGDYTSVGRFERLVYLKKHMEKNSLLTPIKDSFKLLNSVEQLYGLTPVGDKFEYTIYKVVYDMKNLSVNTKKYSEDDFSTLYFNNNFGKDINFVKF